MPITPAEMDRESTRNGSDSKRSHNSQNTPRIDGKLFLN